MAERLSHISLSTQDLERLIRFYETFLDCKIVHDFRNDQGERYGAFLAVGKSATFLEVFNDPTYDANEQGALRHLCFETADIEEEALRFVEGGYAAEVIRGKTDRVLQFKVSDPDGNEIEFHQYDEDCTLWDYISSAKR